MHRHAQTSSTRRPASAPADAAVHALGGEAPRCASASASSARLDRRGGRSPARARSSSAIARVDRGALLGVSRSPSAASAAPWRPAADRHRPALSRRRARRHVVLGVREALLQHARHLVVAQAVARLDRRSGLDARRLLARGDRQQAVGIDREGDRMRAAPATIGGMPRSSKRASERQSATSSRSPCTTWIAIAVWPSWKVVNSCARAVGIVAVARDDALDQPAHGLEPERERDHVEQQQSSPAARCPRARWPGSPRRAPRPGRDRGRSAAARPKNSPTARCTSGMRVEPPTSTTPSTSRALELGVAQGLAHGGERAFDERPRSTCSNSARVERAGAASGRTTACTRSVGFGALDERLLRRARRGEQPARVAPRASATAARLRQRPGGERVVEVVAAQGRVAAGGDHLEHAARQAQERDVEGAAAEVVDGVEALGAVVEAVGDARPRSAR